MSSPITHRTHIKCTQALYESLQEHDDTRTPEYYGAYGDGVHDDTVALTNCLTSNANGMVRLGRNKTYRCANLSIPTGTGIEGVGWNSVLELIDNAPAGACVVTTPAGSYFQSLRNLCIEGNKTGATSAYDGVYINGSTRFLMDRVRVRNCKRHGVYANGAADKYSIQPTLSNSSIEYCDNAGVYVGDYCSDMQMSNLDIGYCLVRGIELRAGNSVMVANTSIWQCAIGVMGWWNERSTFNGLRVEHSTTHAVELHSCRNLNFTGCKIYLSGEGSNGTYAGFYLAGDAGRTTEDVTITGCHVGNYNDGASEKLGFGVKDSGSNVNYLRVVGNNFRGCDTATSLTGANNVVADNG